LAILGGMLLAEDLLLLLTDDETGKLVVSGSEADIALGGAQLVELSMSGHVDLDDRKRLVVRDSTPTGDDLLDRALATITDREGKKPSSVIGPLGKKLRDALYERLTSAGVLRAEEGRVLGVFPAKRWPAASAEHEAAVRRGMTSALVQGTTPEPRDAALISLLHALRSTHKVVDPKQHDLKRKELDRRAKDIAEGDWASKAVRQAVDEMMAAVTVAVSAATVATTAGSS
jgi:hypothetical protein